MKVYQLLIGAPIGALLAATIFVGAPTWVFYATTKQDVDVVVNRVDKTSSGSYVYLSQDPFEWGMIKNDDNWWILKRNSGVLMGKLIEGAKCNLSVYGWRITWFSWAPNLLSVNSCVK
jgi:hypothetical protein